MIKQLITAAAFTVFVTSATAQHAHSDIDALVENGQIVLEAGIPLSGGGLLFESEFGELGNPYGTDEPGFVLDDGSFNAGDILSFNVVSTLRYWDGANWLTSTPGSESISILDSLGVTSIVTDSSITNPLGIVDAADALGGVHTHIDFEINSTASTGAYLLELALRGFSDTSLTSELYTASDPFFIAFNYGLEEEAFELSVDALGVSEVPVPAAWLFFASGLGALLIGRRAKA